MHLILLLLVFTSAHAQQHIALRNCDKSDTSILNCLKALFDANGDNEITVAEIDSTLAREGVYAGGISRSKIMEADYDGNGKLDMNDWNSPDREIFKSITTREYACVVCRANHINMDLN